MPDRRADRWLRWARANAERTRHGLAGALSRYSAGFARDCEAMTRYSQDPGQIDELWVLDVNGVVAVVNAAYGRLGARGGLPGQPRP
jgi:hypothetical protein